MRSSYAGLLGGLAFAIVLVYLLMVVNFQSWLEPFIVITALPAALAGIAWFLLITQTNLSQHRFRAALRSLIPVGLRRLDVFESTEHVQMATYPEFARDAL